MNKHIRKVLKDNGLNIDKKARTVTLSISRK